MNPRWTRRRFLLTLFWSSVLPPVAGAWFSCRRNSSTSEQKEPFREKVQALLEVLWGKENPDVQVLGLVDFAMWVLEDSHFDPEIREMLRDTVEELDEFARKTWGRSFVELPWEEREDVLLKWLKTDPETHERRLALWVDRLLEGLLTDPLYGGNQKEWGWRWLDHFPGYPRVDEGTRYPDLTHGQANVQPPDEYSSRNRSG